MWRDLFGLCRTWNSLLDNIVFAESVILLSFNQSILATVYEDLCYDYLRLSLCRDTVVDLDIHVLSAVDMLK